MVNKQTNQQTNQGRNITSFIEVITVANIGLRIAMSFV